MDEDQLNDLNIEEFEEENIDNNNEEEMEEEEEEETNHFQHGYCGTNAMSKNGPNEAELLALQKIDEKSSELQREGKYGEALECLEKGLVLRQHFFGSNSTQVWESCRVVGEMCNLLAMTYLQQEDFATVEELLKKAEILTENNPTGLAVTRNNMACMHRRKGHLHKALVNLTAALKIEAGLEHVPNRADTFLNMCAVLSQLGKHQGALENAQSALILLQEELFAGPEAQNNAIEEKSDRVAVLAIAYHNVGVEYEFLKKIDSSIHSYKKGADIAEQYLGPNHGIVVTLKNSLLSAQKSKKKATAFSRRFKNSLQIGEKIKFKRKKSQKDLKKVAIQG